MSLGLKIQAFRKGKNLSQKELAAIVGVTTGMIAEWESDESEPNLAELSQLSKALDISTDNLLSVTTEGNVAPAITSRQEYKPTIVPEKKRKKCRWLIVIAALCSLLVIIGSVLWTIGIFDSEPLLFVEDTAKIEAADASVVTIFCYDYKGELAATGSGFVAFDGKTIITNYHVMTSAYTCKISTNQDISFDVTGIHCYSKEQDIAILHVAKDTGLAPLKLGDSNIIKKGETVVAIGSPLGIKNTVSTGVLSGRLMEDSMDVLQFTAPISSGSSGGALFDKNGNVIGITYASYADGQNLNLAIPIELAVDLYQSKETTKNVSSIYAEKHPYLSTLLRYKDAPIVSVSDLIQNPRKYDDQYIKLYAYVSSQGTQSILGIETFEMWFFSEQQHISHDFEYDNRVSAPYNGINYSDSPVIGTAISNTLSEYVDNSISEGDFVMVLALFDFHQKGELMAPGNPNSDRYDYDDANLYCVIIAPA